MSDKDKEPTVAGVFDRILIGGVTELKKKTANTVSEVTNAIVPDLLPDMQNIDNMVNTANIACYSLIAFSLTGTFLFSMRIIREFGQWRQWYKYRNMLSSRNKKVIKEESMK